MQQSIFISICTLSPSVIERLSREIPLRIMSKGDNIWKQKRRKLRHQRLVRNVEKTKGSNSKRFWCKKPQNESQCPMNPERLMDGSGVM